MRRYEIKLKTIDHKKNKHKCSKCGKEAIAKIVFKTWWINLHKKDFTQIYICNDCSKDLIKEIIKEIEEEND